MKKEQSQLEKILLIRKNLAQFFIDKNKLASQKHSVFASLLRNKYKLSKQQACDLCETYNAIANIRSLKLSERRKLFFIHKKHTGHLLHVVESEQFTKTEIEKYINYALRLKHYLSKNKDNYVKRLKLKKLLPDKIIFNLFIERSLRTHRSFDAAAKMLGASVINEKDPAAISLMSRNESFADSIRTFCQYADLIVLRAPWAYSTEEAIESQRNLQNITSVINAGSGSDQHPTQGLLDIMTIKEALGIKSFEELKKKRVAIIGTKFKRALRSFIITLHAVCPEIEFSIITSPQQPFPEDIIKKLNLGTPNITISNSLKDGIRNALVIYLARPEIELANYNPKIFRLTIRDLEIANERCIILHPLPRTDEMDYDFDKVSSNKIWNQVENGLYIRSILLLDCFGRLEKLDKILQRV